MSNGWLRVGLQTFHGERLEVPFEYAIAHGFTSFEWFPDRGHSGRGGWDEREVTSETRQHFKEQAANAGLWVTVHASLEFNPLTAPESERIWSTCEFACEVGANLVNVHLEPEETFVDKLMPTIRVTREYGLRLALENTVYTSPEDFNRAFAEMKAKLGTEADHVGMCFDLGHANACDATRNDYLGFLDRLSPEVPIIHLHFHENHGDRDSHLTLFTGPSAQNDAGIRGVLERLKARGYDGSCVLEQWPTPREQLLNARDGLMQRVAAM